MRLASLSVASSVLLSACGGTVIRGTVNDEVLNAQDAVFIVGKTSTGGVDSAMVFIADRTGLCRLIKDNRRAREMTSMSLLLTKWDGTKLVEPVAGEYVVNKSPPSAAGQFVAGGFSKLDNTCANTIDGTVGAWSAGTARLNTLKLQAGGTVAGTFALSAGEQGDRITGSFSATFCDATIGVNPTCI